jgi:hypothetical protein
MPILEKPLTRADLMRDYCRHYEAMTKAVADLESGAMAIDAEMHADLEKVLLEAGSRQGNLWGFNLLLDETGDNFIVFTSLINIRPAQGNVSMDIQDPIVCEKIRHIVRRWIPDA